MGYVPALDGVRGIAALGVLLVHYLYPVAATRTPLTFVGGEYGVNVFFALSGFLITTLLVEEYREFGTVHLRAFWVRRALRLVPALLLVTISVVLLGALVDAGAPLSGQGLDDIPAEPSAGELLHYLPFWPGILVNIFPVSNWVWLDGYQFAPMGVGWSLAIEDQFYLLWPFVLLVLLARCGFTLRTAALAVAALAIASLLWRNVVFRTAGPLFQQRTDYYFAELLIGCACALAVSTGIVPTRPVSRRILGVFAWFSLAVLLVMFSQGRPYFLNWFFALVGLLTGVLMVHLVLDRGSRLSILLSWAPLVGIGQVSYGLYLWHWVWLKYPTTSDPLRLPVAVTLTMLSVLASYFLVERPALRLKQRYTRHSDHQVIRPSENPVRMGMTRRDALPLLGMSTVVAASFFIYVVGSRFFPDHPVASAPSPGASSTANAAAPTVAKPTRVPRRTRRATQRENRRNAKKRPSKQHKRETQREVP